MAGKIPFNPFPITGENPYNQPSNRNIAPIVNFEKGGIPEISAGYKQRFVERRINRYTLQQLTNVQNVNMLTADNNGLVGYIELGKLIGVKSPFIFIPDFYSITLESVSGIATDLTLSSWNVSLYDLVAGDSMFSQSPSNPSSDFVRLGFEFNLPILQHDDFCNLDNQNYLNYLEHLAIVPGGTLFNNAYATRDVLVKTLMVWRLEQIQV